METKELLDIEILKEEIFTELKTLFTKVKKIELDWTEEIAKENINSVLEQTENMYSKQKWEIKLKDSLRFSITDEFAEFFLTEELLTPNVSREITNDFKKFSSISFIRHNYLEIQSKEKCLLYPIYILTIPLPEKKWFEFVLEHSLSKEIQKISLMNKFNECGVSNHNFRSYINEKIWVLLKEELTIVNNLLNEYINNKFEEFLYRKKNS